MVRNPVFLVLGGAALIALVALPVLGHSPNRLLSGQPISAFAAPAPWSLALLACIMAVTAIGLAPQSRGIVLAALLAGLALPIVYAWGAGSAANDLAASDPPAARTSVGAAGWIVIVLGYLTAAEATRRLALPPLGHAVAVFLAVAPISLLLAVGHLDELAILKEYAIKRDTFGASVAQHARIVVAAFLPAIIIGLPLGVWAHRSARARGTLLTVLNIIQTVPSIALFGLLMAPLSYAARHAPWVADLGISGIGLAPAAVALILYSLLPIVRNTAAGLDAVPDDAVDAAVGMGMSRWQILTRIEVPLAFPVILSGLRITLVQAIGLAAVAALIGAGGLGAIMFQGLFANATAQILLGTLPIVVMAVGVDILFRLVAAMWQPARP